jgi:Family of unknown function (DUF5670)
MHMTIFMISLVLWLVGMVTASTFGGLIHLLLLLAVVMAGIGFVKRRRRLAAVARTK